MSVSFFDKIRSAHSLHSEQEDAEELTHLMLDAMPFGCFLWDKDLNTLSCNQESVRLFKVSSKQECIDKFSHLSPEYQICGKLSLEMAREKVKETFETGCTQFEWMHQTINGEPIPAEMTLVRIQYKGEYIVAAYVRDLREFKAMLKEINKNQEELRAARDAAQVANVAKSAFLANMSHEIRTPMNSIIGFAELAMDDNISANTKEYLEKILENGEGLLQIINDILDISKVESGKMELEHIPFELHDILSRCQTAILPKTMEKGTQLYFYAEPSIGKKLLGDPTRLRQVLINFLSNAVKFTNVGTIKLSSAITKTTENTVTIYFEIKDSGIGMTPEQIAKICEPFTQGDASTTRKYGGTGLGLSISKNLIELMGGKLTVESAVGLGSKFCFSLTFDTIDVPVEAQKSDLAVEKIEKPTFDGEILVCEDNAMNQRVIREYLSRVGIKAVIAENGRDGVEMVRSRKEKGEKRFDLIFMDIHMPVMDGLEAALKIAQLETGTPVVAMTANIMSNDKDLYRASGMPDHVGKPFTSQELWRCLLKYLTPINSLSAPEAAVSGPAVQAPSASGPAQNNAPQSAPRAAPIDDDAEMQKMMETLFVKNNQGKFEEVAQALQKNDIELAHRLAHTLKGNAGQIGRSRLQSAAFEVEKALKEGKNNATEEQLKKMEAELNIVLRELEPLLHESENPAEAAPAEKVAPDQMRGLIKKLEPLLKSGNPESLDMVKDIRGISEEGWQWMIQQMEDFDFKSAAATLAEIKTRMGIQ